MATYDGVASQGTGLIELDMDKGTKYFVVSSEDFSVLTYEYNWFIIRTRVINKLNK